MMRASLRLKDAMLVEKEEGRSSKGEWRWVEWGKPLPVLLPYISPRALTVANGQRRVAQLPAPHRWPRGAAHHYSASGSGTAHQPKGKPRGSRSGMALRRPAWPIFGPSLCRSPFRSSPAGRAGGYCQRCGDGGPHSMLVGQAVIGPRRRSLSIRLGGSTGGPK